MFGKRKQKAQADEAPKRKLGLPPVVRNILISAVVLTLLCVGAGVAYTLFVGQSGPPPGATHPVAQATLPQVKAPTIAPNVPESASVEAFTSPVAPGSNSSIDVKTLPHSVCKISVIYNKVPSTDSGLSPKTADEFGVVSWSWTVDSSAPLGSWPISITCDYQGRTAVVDAQLEVAKQ